MSLMYRCCNVHLIGKSIDNETLFKNVLCYRNICRKVKSGTKTGAEFELEIVSSKLTERVIIKWFVLHEKIINKQ